jgi:hypothetical protein
MVKSKNPNTVIDEIFANLNKLIKAETTEAVDQLQKQIELDIQAASAQLTAELAAIEKDDKELK